METTSSESDREPGRHLKRALASCRWAFAAVAVFSALVNILMLTSSFFMLEIYDRVLASHSIPTLVGLCVLAGALYLFLATFDALRLRILARIGMRIDENVSSRVYETVLTAPVRAPGSGEWSYPLRDLDSIRSFLGGLGPTAAFDLPWFPFYLAICFVFHVWIGAAATAGALVLVILTMITEHRTRAAVARTTALASRRSAMAETERRNAEAIASMGMVGRLAARWQSVNTDYMASQRRASDLAGGMGSVSKIFRMTLQSGILAIGAWLVIRQEATAGIIIAASILSSRALAPIELSIAHWKGFVAARQAWWRLSKMFGQAADRPEGFRLPAPVRSLSVERLHVAAPGSKRTIVHDVSFELAAGEGLGIVGANGSGKSSLIRALVGAWRPQGGRVMLDDAPLEQWHPDHLGRHVGYLPQDIEMIDGTVAQNIARFDPEAPPDAVIAAARLAGVHEMILDLPSGYDTRIGTRDAPLSSGQTQRIGLARALYGDPFLVVMDEPNSNLDPEGEKALTGAIQAMRERGSIVVVVAHRPAAIAGVDRIMAMASGRVRAFGPKNEILRQAQSA